MNPLSFTNAMVSVAQPLQGLTNVTSKQNQLYDMQVDDTEMRLLLADLYNHLGVQPRNGARMDAQNILLHMTQTQAYELAQQKFMERQYAYMNGSVLERFRRFIGGEPAPPMHPHAPVQGYQQQQAMYPPQGQMMYQAPPMGYPQPPMPQAQPNQEMDVLKDQVNKLTSIVEQMALNMNKQNGEKP